MVEKIEIYAVLLHSTITTGNTSKDSNIPTKVIPDELQEDFEKKWTIKDALNYVISGELKVSEDNLLEDIAKKLVEKAKIKIETDDRIDQNCLLNGLSIKDKLDDKVCNEKYITRVKNRGLLHFSYAISIEQGIDI